MEPKIKALILLVIIIVIVFFAIKIQSKNNKKRALEALNRPVVPNPKINTPEIVPGTAENSKKIHIKSWFAWIGAFLAFIIGMVSSYSVKGGNSSDDAVAGLIIGARTGFLGYIACYIIGWIIESIINWGKK